MKFAKRILIFAGFAACFSFFAVQVFVRASRELAKPKHFRYSRSLFWPILSRSLQI